MSNACGANGIGGAAIKRLIPHRYPMLLVDRVLEVVPGERIVTLKAVTCNEPWYSRLAEDAADEDYGYPASLLIESWCQTAALLAAWHQPPDALADQTTLLGGIGGLEIRGSARPGDVVRHEVRLARSLGDTWVFEGTSSIGAKAVLTVDNVMTALRPSATLTRGI